MPGLFADDIVPAPKVRGEGQNIYKQHQGTIQNIILEVEGRSFLGNQTKSTYKKPKDHIYENVKRMRQIQRSCRARVDESESTDAAPVKALWRSKKYADVPSKVSQFLTINFNEQNRRPASARPSRVKEGGKDGNAEGNRENERKPRRPQSARPASSQRPDIVPPLGDIEENSSVGKRVPRNIIRDNALAASHAQIKRAPSAVTLKEAQIRFEEDLKANHQPGKVPDYIIEIKKQREAAEIERIKNLPDPDQPPGHRMLPENDRRATLEKLQQRERELTGQLLRLPLRIDTPRMVKFKNDIEMQLSQVDEAIRVFSRHKVFVKCD